MSTETLLSIGIGLFLLLCTIIPYWIWIHKKDARTKAAYARAEKAGLTEPPSMHPVIDPDLCIGSGACVAACPEKEVLGIVNGKAHLIHAARCIGHGRCFHACPVGAISLVFGTAKRGVDIPHVSEHFETNVPELYIAGELGGMGLIRNAVTQGRQAVAHIAQVGTRGDDRVLDLLIVGAGPAGLSASLEAKRQGLRFETLEQNDIGGAILHYPRRKLVMTQPMDIPLYGQIREREMLKEDLMTLWQDIVKRTELPVHTFCKVENIEKQNGVFSVTSSKDTFLARHVLMAIGRRGTPRKLGVPGEALPKVAYGLLEPEQYQGQKILVVGGGDSALEAACALAEEPGNQVTVSYRQAQFTRPKEAVKQRMAALEAAGKLSVVFSSQVQKIEEEQVILDCEGIAKTISNDSVFVFAGGELPTAFLKQVGVLVETKFGQQ